MPKQNPTSITSQWDDIHRKLGNFAPLPEKEPDPELPIYNVDNNKDKLDKLENTPAEKLNELEDENWDDERFFEIYKKQRMAELLQEQRKATEYNTTEIKLIGKEKWQSEVTHADGFILVHLFDTKVALCKNIETIMEQVAKKFPTVKYLKILATDAIANYPEKNVPTLLLYHNTNPVDQLIGPISFGSKYTAEDLERFLAKNSAITSKLNKTATRARYADSDEE